MGLDRDDTIIRRRLRQKLEFLVEDAARSAPPTDAELQAWLDGAPRGVPRRAAAGVPAGLREPGAARRGGARRTRARSSPGSGRGPGRGHRRRWATPSMLPSELPLVAAARGRAGPSARSSPQELMKIEPGQWTGPVESAYGLHLVLVRERVDGRRAGARRGPAAGRARGARASGGKRELDALYERLLAKYTVSDREADGEAAARGRGRRRRGAVMRAARPAARSRCSCSRRRHAASRTRCGPASSSCARPGPDTYSFLWKKPTGGEIEIQIAPVVPKDCRLATPDRSSSRRAPSSCAAR